MVLVIKLNILTGAENKNKKIKIPIGDRRFLAAGCQELQSAVMIFSRL
jgi:hypothetical protein